MKRFHPHFRGYKIGFNEGKVNSYLPSINSDLYVADMNYFSEFQSSESKVRSNIDSTSRIIIRSWGTENSVLEGMLKR